MSCMRHCIHSRVEAADDLTPIYLCTKLKKIGIREPDCVLYDQDQCKLYEY